MIKISDFVKILPRYRVDNTNKVAISKKKSNNKRKTTEQYKQELLDKGISVEPIEDYVNAREKILHRCKICNNEWYATPSNILNDRTYCLKCYGKIKRNRTTSEYQAELFMKNPCIEVVDEFINATTNILHHCKICNYEWNAKPSNILSGKGCPNCGIKRRNLGRKPTQEEYITRVKLKNKLLDVVGTYVDMNTKIEHKCLICNNIIMITPEHVLRGYGCKKCSSLRTRQKLLLSPEQFEKNVHKNDCNIILTTKYVDNKTPINCQCKSCGHKWIVKSPFQLYNSHCPRCVAIEKGEKSRLDYNTFQSTILPDITLLSDYIGINQKIDCSCNKCGFSWTVNQAGSLRRSGCPNCNKSHGESRIKLYLDNNNISYKWQKCFKGLVGIGGGLLLYDFYIEQYNLLIEFQGKQHKQIVQYFGGKEQFKKQQEHDRRKRKYAKDHNINLLEIWYYDIDKIDNILEQTLNNLKSESLTTAG